MLYKRHAQETINKLSKMFGAVLVTGARQAGKTTLLKEHSGNIGYVSLDDSIQLISAVNQAATFFKDNPPPVIIDEIQYAPNLFRQIKIILDTDKKKGQFYLSGSQQFAMMKNVSESLAGRLGMVILPCLSLREIFGVSEGQPFLPVDEYFALRKKQTAEISYDDIWNCIHRGSYPELCANPDYDRGMFYGAYVKTYIERDVRDLLQIGSEIKFMQFLTITAGYTGQMLNLASIAREIGISGPTAERWLSVLVASDIAFLLRPYYNNITKRTVKTPKLYFRDTGLAAYLTRWNTPDVLKNGAMAGAFFETFIIGEIIKSYSNAGILDIPVYYYRDRDGTQIDLLIEEGGTLYPIEIKKHADPDKKDVSKFAVLDKLPNIKRGQGGVVCMYDKLITINENDRVIPVNLL